MVQAGLERHYVRKTMHDPSAYGFRSGADTRPQWKRIWVSRNPFQKRVHLADKLTAQTRALLVVPQSCGP